MNRKTLLIVLFFALPRLYAAEHQWNLKQSRLTYHASDPLHQGEGTSRAARGKGICHDTQCDFLIAVPVKTFDSGDANRDLRMMQLVRGVEFPMITVRARLPETDSTAMSIKADLEIQFAGQTVHYNQVPFEILPQGKEKRITGTIPATFADFKIDPPLFLNAPAKNEIPIHVDMVWTRQ